MHFEFLSEDKSGAILLEKILPRFFAGMSDITFRIHPFRGIGRIPKDLKATGNPAHRILLAQLPRHLKGYLNVPGIDAVVVLLDADDRPIQAFERELKQFAIEKGADAMAIFCLAVEEMEAWLLGDIKAVLKAYPKARRKILDQYRQDSICGTWEVLADAIHPGGSRSLSKQPYPIVGRAKCEWAENIAVHLDFENNESMSFRKFTRNILEKAA